MTRAVGARRGTPRGATRPPRARVLLPPKPLLDRVRWTFLQFSLVSGCLLTAAVLTRDDAGVGVKAMGVDALAALCWLWIEEYRRDLSARWDIAEGIALVAVGVAV